MAAYGQAMSSNRAMIGVWPPGGMLQMGLLGKVR
jgi:hypothetical protein